MLTCIFHPTDPMRVVEEDEAMDLMDTGFWFDCPSKAKKYRDLVTEDLRREKQQRLMPKNETESFPKKDKTKK